MKMTKMQLKKGRLRSIYHLNSCRGAKCRDGKTLKNRTNSLKFFSQKMLKIVLKRVKVAKHHKKKQNF